MRLRDVLLDLIYPPFCVGCNRLGFWLCPTCEEEIEYLPLSVTVDVEPCYLDGVWAAAYYQSPITQLISELKYRSVKPLARVAALIMYFALTLPDQVVFTAVPLHHARRRFRGFNQAEEIALSLAGLSGATYQELVVRVRHTPHQAGLADATARSVNIARAFALALPPEDLPEQVVLVDDVVTTGNTLNEVARVLKEAGVKQVYAACLAHGG